MWKAIKAAWRSIAEADTVYAGPGPLERVAREHQELWAANYLRLAHADAEARWNRSPRVCPFCGACDYTHVLPSDGRTPVSDTKASNQ